MRLIILLFSITLLFAQDISEKLIISSDKSPTLAQMDFLKLKMYFIENSQMRALQEKYKLNLEMQTLGGYTMVVIKPIKSLEVKNELLLSLSPLFKDIFSIEDNKKEKKSSYNLKESQTIKTFNPSTDTKMIYKIRILVEEIGLQWITLFFLSVIGLTLSLRSRSKMESLEDTQKELRFKQEKVEEEIKKLGASDA